MKITRVRRILDEAIYKVGNPEDDKVIWDRVVDLRRVADRAREAAKKATSMGKDDLAKQLIKTADEFEELADNANVDELDDEENNNTENEADLDSNAENQNDSNNAQGNSNNENNNGPGQDSEQQDGNGNKDGQKTNPNENAKDDASEDDGEDPGIDEDDEGEDEEDYDDEGRSQDNSDSKGDDDGSDSGEDNEDESDSNNGSSSNQNKDKSENNSEGNNDKSDADEDTKGDDGEGESEDDGEGDEEADKDASSKQDKSGRKDSDEDTKSDSDLDSEEGESADSDEEDEEERTQEKNKGKGQSGESEEGEEGDEETSDSDEGEEDEEDEDEDEEQSGSTQNQSEKQSKGGKAPKKDPFADEEDIPSLALPSQNGQEPEEADLDDILKELQGLNGEAKRGAKDALQAILDKNWPKTTATESLHLQEKLSLRNMDEDEFQELLHKGYDLVNQIEQNPGEKAVQDRKGRLQALQDIMDDPTTVNEIRRDLEKDVQAEMRAKKAEERRTKRYASVGSMKDFAFNINKALADEIQYDEYTDYSYDDIDPQYEDEDVRVKAEVTRERSWPVKPVLDVYFDQSSSWKAADIEVGKRALNSLIEFEEQDLLTINLWYFSDVVTSDEHDGRLRSGTDAWDDIIDNIKRTGANNIVIMTDADMDWFNENYHHNRVKSLTVPGYVWWIWKNGEQATGCMQLLKGRKGVSQYSFNTSDYQD